MFVIYLQKHNAKDLLYENATITYADKRTPLSQLMSVRPGVQNTTWNNIIYKLIQVCYMGYVIMYHRQHGIPFWLYFMYVDKQIIWVCCMGYVIMYHRQHGIPFWLHFMYVDKQVFHLSSIVYIYIYKLVFESTYCKLIHMNW